MKNANMAKRIAVIRLIMQGYLGIQVAEILNLQRETVSVYVQKFHQGGHGCAIRMSGCICFQTKNMN